MTTNRQRNSTLLLVAALLLFANPDARAEQFTGKVIGVTDGDTIKVLRDRRSEVIRLADIDAPEKNQDFGAASKKFTSRLAFGKTVTVDCIGHDRYRRTIARVTLPDGQSLNRELVKEGFAWRFVKYCKDDQLQQLEKDARTCRRGLWQAPNAVAPWDYRQEAKQSKVSSKEN